MPVNPAAWVTGQPVSAKKLNTDLYAFKNGNAYAPNGILFHAQRPTLMEYLYDTFVSYQQPFSFGGSVQALIRSGVNQALWWNVWDSSAYYGPGADVAAFNASGTFQALVPGARGLSEVSPTGKGWYMVGGHVDIQAVPAGNSPASFGTGLTINQSTSQLTMGAIQRASQVRDNTAFVLDLYNPANATDNVTVVGWGGSTTGAASVQYHPANVQLTDWSGETSRLFTYWASIDKVNGTAVAAGPSVPAAFTGASAITTSLLNTDLTNNLNFLNMPPILRAAYQLSATINNGLAVQVVPLAGTTDGPQIDTYNGFSATTHLYTVPVSGVYLVHGCVTYTPDATAAYQAQAGVQIGALNLWGPSYTTTGSANGGCGNVATVTRLLDLNANDTVALITRTNKGAANTTYWNTPGVPCKLVVQWVGALGTPSTLWTNPDTSFRWQAGTPGSQLASLFNTHVQNDLGFLIQKPYLLSYQTVTTGQTAFAANTPGNLIMNLAQGRVHASVGDNYSGYSTVTGVYTAQRAGWYLVVGEYTIATNASMPYPIVAQVTAPGTGNQLDAKYWGQHIDTSDGNATALAGATYCNLHYLRVNDTIRPTAQVQPANGTNTWGVATATGQESSFGLIWLSQ